MALEHLVRKNQDSLDRKKPAVKSSASKETTARNSNYPTIQKALESWLSDNHAQGFSNKTIVERRGFIQRLIWWFENEEKTTSPTIGDVDAQTIRRFLSYVRRPNETGRFGSNNSRCKMEASQNTVFNYHCVIVTLFNWLTDEGYFDESPLANLKRPKVAPHLVEPFTEDQVKTLIAGTVHTDYPLRNKAIILLLAETGLRISELCSLNIASVEHEVITIIGKGNKKRQVFLGKTTRRFLRQYIKQDREDASPDEPLFIGECGTKRGERLQANGIRIMLRRLGKNCGISEVRCSPHTFRHFFAVTCLRSGMSGYQLMRLLGHTDLEMTKRYLNLTQEDLKTAHALASPMDRLLK